MTRVADPLDRWPAFVGAVHRRLAAGRSLYGDRSFSDDPRRLLAELQQELEDVAGWGFVLWLRLERIREVLGTGSTTQGDANNDAPRTARGAE